MLQHCLYTDQETFILTVDSEQSVHYIILKNRE